MNTSKPFSRLMALVLSITLVFSMTTVVSAAEGGGHWSDAAVKACTDAGVIEGVINPDTVITRAEFARMVNRAFNFTKTEGAQSFTDVDNNTPYANDIKIATAMD